MRRRPFLTLYLVLLVLSTAARARLYFGEREDLTPYWTGVAGPPVMVMDGAGAGWRSFEIEWALRREHRLGLVPDGQDPTLLLGGADPTPIHIVAIGTAGPRAIMLATLVPNRIASLTLIDAYGIEEFDLLGDHRLNHILRRTQVVATEALRWLTPHFGILDFLLSGDERAAARLLSYDRRTIRDDLRRWNGPAAIFTADQSPPRVATAREHARLLPQSSLSGWTPDSLSAFLDRVDAGTATTRATAPPSRIAAAALPFDAHGIASADGTALLLVLALLALTTLLSEDLACVTAGMLAARGSIPLVPAIIACYVGIVAGDQLLYLLGRSAGRALVTRIPIKWILTPDRLDRACEWARTSGMRVVLISRFLPGTRFPVYVAAGILRAGFWRFAAWLMAIGAIWTPALVGLSYIATRQGRGLLESLPGETWIWAVGAMIAGVLLLRWGVGAAGHRWAGTTPLDEG